MIAGIPRLPDSQQGTQALESDLLTLAPGEPWPLGAHHCHSGTNFAVFSRHASGMELWIFDDVNALAPSMRVVLDPLHYRTGDIWHVLIGSNLCGHCYMFRAAGASASNQRDRFDAHQLLLDPYTHLVAAWSTPSVESGDRQITDRFRRALGGVIIDQDFDWQGVSRPQHSWSDTIIYETHVRGLTIHPSSGARHPGQYLGVIEKIPYLRSLGITAIELLPVQAFGAQPGAPSAGASGHRTDYWGYNPIAFFSPHPGYGSAQSLESPLVDFKCMVRELHRAGIEVILDVVFNHTGEGGLEGPIYSFRGLDNDIYYMLTPDGSRYLDYTGCGNTLNCNHPVVRSMIVECLRHWVVHMHIDGFRFDLAAVLGRGEDGKVLLNAPVLEEIAQDPILRNVKLIAEAWDSAGTFQVGRFAGARWGEWNCHFRDDVRRFWRGDPGLTGALASRFCGSADLYQHDEQTPGKSINFVTSHDGFTLQDLVSYAGKHNERNGEENRDGMNENFSANYGVEGPTPDPAINNLRLRHTKNVLATLLLARGVPMLLGGDEFARTQMGNNNAYCQDNEVSWCDWAFVERNATLVRFVQRVIALRKTYAALRAERFYTSQEIEWIGAFGQAPEWQGPHNRVACVIRSDRCLLALLFNATTEQCEFGLPRASSDVWQVCIDTGRLAPDDAPDENSARRVANSASIKVGPRSLLALSALPAD